MASSWMRSLTVCLSLVSWWCAVLPGMEGAGNIDVLEPIVRHSPAAEGADDLFGYSVTLHQIRVPSNFQEALESTRIIVGAPRGTYPGGLLNIPSDGTVNPENQTGLVYSCSVSQGSCDRLGSGSGVDERLFDPKPNAYVPTNFMSGTDCTNPSGGQSGCSMEGKAQQLMGATVVSSEGLLVVCAPRFTVEDILRLSTSGAQDLDTRRPIGRCFYSRNLTDFAEMRPCVPTTTRGLFNANRCVAGTSAVITPSQEREQTVVLGTPGQDNFRGGGALYQFTSTSSSLTTPSKLENLTLESNTYEGYALAVGNITGAERLDYILTVPRADGIDYQGTVVIRQASSLHLVQNDTRGTQLAEYFGWSVAAADLNNDGYDEVIVGAPLYSTPTIQEHGRVYVFMNTGGMLSASNPIVLAGDTVARARFGTSVVKLGDVNDDGYEDFAVGAPYQEVSVNSGNTGKVFIYYGSSAFTDDVADQTITADEVVASVSGLNQLKAFGWSLSSGVDVDNNQYRDLLVGAYESGTAVLFRALSVARINISASTNLTDDTLNIDLTTPSPAFNLRICASFDGRGLTGQLKTTLNVNEMLSSGSRRLLFDGSEQYSEPFTFARSNMETCKNVVITIKNKPSLYSAGTTVDNFQIQFTLSQRQRVTPPGYDGNPGNLTDLRDLPILVISGNESITVVPEVNCQGMKMCSPDLTPTVQSYNYSSSLNNRTYPDVVAGSTGVDTITVGLIVRNLNTDVAIGSQFTISMPLQFGFQQGSTNTGAQIECAQQGRTNMYSCNLPNFIGGNTAEMVKLVWKRAAQAAIVGDEEDFTSNIAVMVSDDSNPGNNEAMQIIDFSAVVDVEVTNVRRSRGPSTYNAEVPVSTIASYDQLGPLVQWIISLQNRGPSTLEMRDSTSVNVEIYLPTQDADTRPNFYFYPASYMGLAGEATLECNNRGFNPNSYTAPPSNTGNGRRRRSAPSKRQTTDPSPQDSNAIPAGSVIQNCSAAPSQRSGCSGRFDCSITSWGPNQAITITIDTYLDRRFFSTRTTPFTFIAFARVSVMSPFSRDDNLANNYNSSIPYSITKEAQEQDNTTLFIVVSIVAVIGALLLLIGLFCLLYFVGFFRRKKFGKEEAEGDFEVRELPPEGTANGDKPILPAEEEVVGENQEGTPTKEDPTGNDIGDTADLQDTEVASPEADPDETSL